jgi:predicted nucleic acid-binding protein
VSKLFVDTSLLAYQFDAPEPDKQKRARDVLSATEHTLVFSTHVLLELSSSLSPAYSPRRGQRRDLRQNELLSTSPEVTP